MKDTTKIGIYFLIGVIMLVVPITYTLTTMANNLKNIDTNQNHAGHLKSLMKARLTVFHLAILEKLSQLQRF